MIDYHLKGNADTTDLCVWHVGALRQMDFAGKRVLDIGCGSGAFLKHIRQQGAECLGIDPNPLNCRIARESGLDILEGYFSADFHDELCRFKPQIVTCFEVIEHIYSPMEIFNEVKCLLQQTANGTFIVTTPNAFNIMRAVSFVSQQRHHDPMMDPIRFEAPEHIRAYSYQMLKTGLSKVGFKNVSGKGVLTVRGKTMLLHNSWMAKWFGQNLIMTASI